MKTLLSFIVIALLGDAARGAQLSEIIHYPQPINRSTSEITNVDDFDPIIETMVDSVSQEHYQNYIQTLENFVSRSTFTSNCDSAAAWIRSQFQSFGLNAYYDTFAIEDDNHQWYTKFNVIGEKVGLCDPGRIIFIGAHFDATAGNPFYPESIAPGADDNGSGVACVLECARILSQPQYIFKNSIRFVAFGAEEQIIIGSTDYVQDLAASGVEVLGYFNLDMIANLGLNGTQFRINYDDNPVSYAMAQKIAEAVQTFLPSGWIAHLAYTPNPYADCEPFHDQGWANTYTWEYDFNTSYYHTINDLVINCNMDYATNITKAELAALADFADPLTITTQVSGSVSGQWSLAGSPYGVVQPIWVPEDSTLTIQPGVIVLFSGGFPLRVLPGATLKAVGTVDNPILFTHSQEQAHWGGIRLIDASDSSLMEFCEINYGNAVGPGQENWGGGIFCDQCNPTIKNCIISHCAAAYGGAIACATQSAPTLINLTITANSATQGGAFYCQNSNPIVENSILWGDLPQEIIVTGSSNLVISYCDVQNGWIGLGNIDVDPLFAAPQMNIYHLKSQWGRFSYYTWIRDTLDSPCIDAGNPLSAYNYEPEPNGNRIDLGCYGNTSQASLSSHDPHYACGMVFGIWTRSSNNPMYVFDDIYVPEDSTLLIESGMQVIFLGLYQFDVFAGATLRALGTSQDSITFTAIDPDVGWHGIRLHSGSDSSRLEYCHFQSAKNSDYGGAISIDSTDVLIKFCTIDSCSAGHGGGIYITESNPTIQFNSICNNSALYGRGGGIDCYITGGLINANKIYGNSAQNGGGISTWMSDCELTNNLICQNNASAQGGGCYLLNLNYTPLLENNTISENAANLGGGLFCVGPLATTVVNCIICNNEPDALQNGGGAGYDVTFSDVENGWIGQGNIDADPLFCSGSLSQYQLSPDSPCIDAGNPDVQYNDPQDPENPGFALFPAQGTLRNDMGAYGGSGCLFVEVPITPEVTIPKAFGITQNYPNPFNPCTKLRITLPEPASVNLNIYDMLGRKVRTILDEWRLAGEYEIVFDASDLASGIYIYQLTANNNSMTKKMLLLK